MPNRLQFRVQGWPLALCLFLPTIYPSSEIMWLPVIVLWFAQSTRLRVYGADALMILFICGVVLLTFCGLSPLITTEQSWSPSPFGYLLLPLCVLIGRSLSPPTVRWLLAFICVEAVVCGFQLMLHQPYVFAGQRDAILNTGVTEWGSTDLLYFNRMYGLSTNSSVAAQKFMLGILLLFDQTAHPRWRPLVFLLLSVGLYSTFNRTALIIIGLFLGLKTFGPVLQSSIKRQLQIMAVVVLAFAVLLMKWPQLENQFLRGNLNNSLVEDSGRTSLWYAGAKAITAHPLVGNLSQRFQVYEYGGWFHLHNSWLQLVADHGLVGWLLIAHSLALVRRRNVAVFLVLASYSFVQFGLFGKISLINIVFYYLMRRPAVLAFTPKSLDLADPAAPKTVHGQFLPAS